MMDRSIGVVNNDTSSNSELYSIVVFEFLMNITVNLPHDSN